MIKIVKVTGWITLDLMFFIVLLFTSVQVVVYNDNYFEWHYRQHDIMNETKMDLNNLMDVTDKMMDYLIDRRDTLDMTAIIEGQEQEVFGEREKAHMIDVKDLFLAGKQLRDLFAIILCVLFLYFAKMKREYLMDWVNQLRIFFISSFIAIAVFAAIISTDFNKYFTLFHELFFKNDLWLLDPETDILVNMVPEIFFFETVLLIVTVFVISIIVTVLISRLFVSRRKTRV